jgi:hypothetical protein
MSMRSTPGASPETEALLRADLILRATDPPPRHQLRVTTAATGFACPFGHLVRRSK